MKELTRYNNPQRKLEKSLNYTVYPTVLSKNDLSLISEIESFVKKSEDPYKTMFQNFIKQIKDGVPLTVKQLQVVNKTSLRYQYQNTNHTNSQESTLSEKELFKLMEEIEILRRKTEDPKLKEMFKNFNEQLAKGKPLTERQMQVIERSRISQPPKTLSLSEKAKAKLLLLKVSQDSINSGLKFKKKK